MAPQLPRLPRPESLRDQPICFLKPVPCTSSPPWPLRASGQPCGVASVLRTHLAPSWRAAVSDACRLVHSSLQTAVAGFQIAAARLAARLTFSCLRPCGGFAPRSDSRAVEDNGNRSEGCSWHQAIRPARLDLRHRRALPRWPWPCGGGLPRQPPQGGGEHAGPPPRTLQAAHMCAFGIQIAIASCYGPFVLSTDERLLG